MAGDYGDDDNMKQNENTIFHSKRGEVGDVSILSPYLYYPVFSRIHDLNLKSKSASN
jgi:hypothetical protein